MNLRVEGIDKRHFETLSKVFKLDIDPWKEGFNFKSMIDLGIIDRLEVIEDLSIRASKENNIRKDLDQMYESWKQFQFEIINMKNSDSSIIKNMETCINTIDESLTITINLVYSPYKLVFEKEINTW